MNIILSQRHRTRSVQLKFKNRCHGLNCAPAPVHNVEVLTSGISECDFVNRVVADVIKIKSYWSSLGP